MIISIGFRIETTISIIWTDYFKYYRYKDNKYNDKKLKDNKHNDKKLEDNKHSYKRHKDNKGNDNTHKDNKQKKITNTILRKIPIKMLINLAHSDSTVRIAVGVA